MDKTTDDILERLNAVEAAISDLAREPDGKQIGKPEVARRYSVSPRTIERWVEDPTLKFPRPDIVRGRWFFKLGDLRAWDRKRTRLQLQPRAAPPRPRRRRKLEPR